MEMYKWYFVDKKEFNTWSRIVAIFAKEYLNYTPEFIKKSFKRKRKNDLPCQYRWGEYTVTCQEAENIKFEDPETKELETFDLKIVTFFKQELLGKWFDKLKGIRYREFEETTYKIILRTKEDKFLMKVVEDKVRRETVED